MINETSLWFIIAWMLLTFAMIGYISILRLEIEHARRDSDFYKQLLDLSDQHVKFLTEKKESEKNVF